MHLGMNRDTTLGVLRLDATTAVSNLHHTVKTMLELNTVRDAFTSRRQCTLCCWRLGVPLCSVLPCLHGCTQSHISFEHAKRSAKSARSPSAMRVLLEFR